MEESKNVNLTSEEFIEKFHELAKKARNIQLNSAMETEKNEKEYYLESRRELYPLIMLTNDVG